MGVPALVIGGLIVAGIVAGACGDGAVSSPPVRLQSTTVSQPKPTAVRVLPTPTRVSTATPTLACPNEAEQDYFSQISSQVVSAFTLLTMFGEELQTTAPWDVLDENWIFALETDIMILNRYFDDLIALQSPVSAAHIDRKVEDMAHQVKQALRSTNAGIQNNDLDMLDVGTSQMELAATKGETLRLAIDSFCR